MTQELNDFSNEPLDLVEDSKQSPLINVDDEEKFVKNLLENLQVSDVERECAIDLTILFMQRNCTSREFQLLAEVVTLDESGVVQPPSKELKDFFAALVVKLDERNLRFRQLEARLKLAGALQTGSSTEFTEMKALPESALLEALIGDHSLQRVMDLFATVDPTQVMFPEIVERAVRLRQRTWNGDEYAQLEAGILTHWFERALEDGPEEL